MKRTTFYFLLLIIGTELFSQNIEFSGKMNGQIVNYKSQEVKAAIEGELNEEYIDIRFPNVSLPGIELKGVKIFNLNLNENNNQRDYEIIKNPEKDTEVALKLNIYGTCSADFRVDKGTLRIEKLSKRKLLADGYVIIIKQPSVFTTGTTADDTLKFSINTSLLKRVKMSPPNFPKEELSSDYQFSNVKLSGDWVDRFKSKSEHNSNVLPAEFKLKGLDYFELELGDEVIEIEICSGFSAELKSLRKNRIDKKLIPGNFEIIPICDCKDNSEYIKFYKTIKKNQLYVLIDKVKEYRDSQVTGELIIDHISEKRCKGSFDLKIMVEEQVETLKGEFEVPVRIL